ncbi:uncharacterized protein LOC110713735 [Chenopodium quinoa]|uniref:uncharacterized protein LOC110713735 n=1 Tax=Chenopodium quinoa TaxID=63459 RepID=UPI000B792E68|nr:uncharacterized protein LOC110713735 [Chenopodium quinoa]
MTVVEKRSQNGRILVVEPTWKLGAFIKRDRRECRVEIGYYLAWYARQRAFKMIFGDVDLEYEQVWDYAVSILKYNPGSTTVVKVDGVQNPQPVFQRLYVCLQACKQGFMAGCRPILGVDGAHLKGAYPGILLTAVGKNGNNNIFPVAWAVVEVENGETWTWFLEILRKDIASVADSVTWVHEADELTYMSDRKKGLLDSFATVMPVADTRYCCRHIWSNFKNKFPGTVYKEHFWKAARSTTEHMEQIKKMSADAYNYLNAIPPAHWSRHKFSSHSKSGMLLNNCCESFNNVLREARTKPILQLMEWFVHRGLQQVSNMRVTQADLMEFEVDDLEDTYVVNLQTKACSCNRLTLMGIPCWHALACIQLRRLDIEQFIHPAYHVETYTKTYAPTFKAMPGHQKWEVTPYPRPLPPAHRNLLGRPSSKKRKKENKCPTPPVEKPKRPPGKPKKVAEAGQPRAGQAAEANSSQASQQSILLSAPHGT